MPRNGGAVNEKVAVVPLPADPTEQNSAGSCGGASVSLGRVEVPAFFCSMEVVS